MVLHPVTPQVNLGSAFPASTIHTVAAPVSVNVNGAKADVVKQIGWPGLVDTYRVDFKMPGAAGDANVQLTVAWANGPAMTIPAR